MLEDVPAETVETTLGGGLGSVPRNEEGHTVLPKALNSRDSGRPHILANSHQMRKDVDPALDGVAEGVEYLEVEGVRMFYSKRSRCLCKKRHKRVGLVRSHIEHLRLSIGQVTVGGHLDVVEFANPKRVVYFILDFVSAIVVIEHLDFIDDHKSVLTLNAYSDSITSSLLLILTLIKHSY